MKDDYLWDKTGEPDPEIQHLERVLGHLRHQRTAQDLPAIEIKRTEPRVFPKMLAIAAAIAFAALTLGAFIVLQRQSKNREANGGPVVMVNIELSQPKIEPNDVPIKVDAAQGQNDQLIKVSDVNPKPATLVARRRNINSSREASSKEREQAEGLMAKEQLIKAIEITSNKLNFVQKKVKGDERQGPSS